MEFTNASSNGSSDRSRLPVRIKARPIMIPQPNGTMREYDPRKDAQRFDGTPAFAQHYRDFIKAALETEYAVKLGGGNSSDSGNAAGVSDHAVGASSSRNSRRATEAMQQHLLEEDVFMEIQQVPAIQMLSDISLCQPLELQRRKRIDPARAHEPEEKMKRDYNDAVDQNNRIPIQINAKREDLNASSSSWSLKL